MSCEDVSKTEEVPPSEDEHLPKEEEIDYEKIEEEKRDEIEKEVAALPEGPEKILRLSGFPSTVYRMSGGARLEIPLSKILKESREIGLYFSASWCNPCQEFTPKLTETYRKVNAEKYADENAGRGDDDVKAFEIILLPVDRKIETHETYFSGMPWWSVSYEGVAYYRMKLCESFKLESIPTLICFDSETGDTLTVEGVDAVERDGVALETYPWKGHAKSFSTKIVNLLISKLPLLAVMGFMMFRNYTNSQQMSAVRTTTTTSTAALLKAVVDTITDEL
eukprot:GHVH01004765.1.p1 GENE.GHVH01004765.1~~GHVH01004765.1.p1  ORF type:complete len:286 (+),score=58.64 GHVH01004765.1:23-859(+)